MTAIQQMESPFSPLPTQQERSSKIHSSHGAAGPTRRSLTDFVEDIYSAHTFTMEDIVLHRDYLNQPSAAHNGFTPLLSAVFNFQYNTVKLMLQLEEGVHSLNHVFSNESPFEGYTAFMLAMYCEEGTIAMCKLLLKYAEKDLVYKKNIYGENLLFVCLKKCGRKEMEFWLDQSGYSWNLNERNVNGQTLLHQSAGLGRVSIVDLLLSYNDSESTHIPVNISQGDNLNGDTALHYALQVHLRRHIPDLGDQDFSVLYRLVRLKADLNIRSKDGTRCLEYCKDEIVPLFEILDKNCDKMPPYLDQLLSYPKNAIMQRFNFLNPNDREHLWNSLEAVRQELQSNIGTGGCPVKSINLKSQQKNQDAESNCPFLKEKKGNPEEVGKCPVPFAESLYYNLPSNRVAVGFSLGFLLGIGCTTLFSLIKGKNQSNS